MIKLADVLQELARIGFANLYDFHRIDRETGLMYFDASEIDREKMAPVAKVKMRRYAEGRAESKREVIETEITLVGKVKALVKLGEHLRAFKGGMAKGSTGDAPDCAALMQREQERIAKLDEIANRFLTYGVAGLNGGSKPEKAETS